jgi:hypothetical protein
MRALAITHALPQRRPHLSKNCPIFFSSEALPKTRNPKPAPLEKVPNLLELGGVAVQRAVLLPGQPRRPRRQRPPRQGARLEQVARQRAGQPAAQPLQI